MKGFAAKQPRVRNVRIKAWAVLASSDCPRPDELTPRVPCANNFDWFQYPIFPTRDEAYAWKHEGYNPERGKVVRVVIEVQK